MNYLDGNAIWLWFLLLTSAMYWYFTKETAWEGPLVYGAFLLIHFALYLRRKKKALKKEDGNGLELRRNEV